MMKKSKKARWILIVSVLILFVAGYYYTRPVLVYLPSGECGDCSWGFEAVEVSRIPILNSMQSKFGDCTDTPLFLKNGNHIPCVSTKE
jgi:hypothetical protein